MVLRSFSMADNYSFDHLESLIMTQKIPLKKEQLMCTKTRKELYEQLHETLAVKQLLGPSFKFVFETNFDDVSDNVIACVIALIVNRITNSKITSYFEYECKTEHDKYIGSHIVKLLTLNNLKTMESNNQCIDIGDSNQEIDNELESKQNDCELADKEILTTEISTTGLKKQKEELKLIQLAESERDAKIKKHHVRRKNNKITRRKEYNALSILYKERSVRHQLSKPELKMERKVTVKETTAQHRFGDYIREKKEADFDARLKQQSIEPEIKQSRWKDTYKTSRNNEPRSFKNNTENSNNLSWSGWRDTEPIKNKTVELVSNKSRITPEPVVSNNNRFAPLSSFKDWRK